MISLRYFRKARTIAVSSYAELLSCCQELRQAHPKTPYHLILKTTDEVGNLIFPYSYFWITQQSGSLTSTLFANQLDSAGKPLTTWKTAALKITGSHNIFEGLGIRNSSGQPEVKGQEVALGIYNTDNLFLNCHFVSTQDTLFVGPLPDDLMTRYLGFLPENERYFEGLAFNGFKNCRIEGTVDFIFGAGQALFEDCTLVTLADVRKETYVVAPSHSLKDDIGFLFEHCQFVAGAGVEDDSTFLARPWRDYGKAVFHDCQYGKHISVLGFHDWSDVNRTKTCRFEEYPLGEGRVTWTRNQKGSILPRRYETLIRQFNKASR